MARPRSPRVLLFSSGHCAYCERTRELLQSLGVGYEDLDVSRSRRAAARFRRLGARGVPVLLIGDRRIDGFQPEVIRRALKGTGIRL